MKTFGEMVVLTARIEGEISDAFEVTGATLWGVPISDEIRRELTRCLAVHVGMMVKWAEHGGRTGYEDVSPNLSKAVTDWAKARAKERGASGAELQAYSEELDRRVAKAKEEAA